MGSAVSISAVLGFLILGGIYFANTQLTLSETNRGVASDQYAVLARGAAIAGTERAKQHLAWSFIEESFEGDFYQGSYAVEVSISGAEATITSEGFVVTSEGTRVARVVKDPNRAGVDEVTPKDPTVLGAAVRPPGELESILAECLDRGRG